MRYRPIDASRIINVCATLHNYLLDHGINGQEFDVVRPNNADDNIIPVVGANQYFEEGRENREWVSRYFEMQN